jgi:hypothetical protein
MNFRWFIEAISDSALHKAHNAEKEPHRPPFRLLGIMLYDRNHRTRVVPQFLAAKRTLIRIQEIAKFNTTVGAFEFFHFCYLIKSFMVPGAVVFWFA